MTRISANLTKGERKKLVSSRNRAAGVRGVLSKFGIKMRPQATETKDGEPVDIGVVPVATMKEKIEKVLLLWV